MIDNPYLDALKAFPWEADWDGVSGPEWYSPDFRTYIEAYQKGKMTRRLSRTDLTRKYAWAIPDTTSLAFVARHLGDSALEIGAGTGYWASLLSDMGVDMLCFDAYPPQITPCNWYHSPRNADDLPTGERRDIFYDVQSGNHMMAWLFSDRPLFLCWPPYDNSMAHQALSFYRGNKLIYIGEGQGGCTGNDAFFDLLEKEWRLIDEYRPTQWAMIHDWISVYTRLLPEERNCSILPLAI